MSSLQRFLSITLADGRRLAWREYGALSGYPVIFLHGNLNSRLFQPMWAATEAKSEAAGARVIAIDLPGYGESTYHPDRSYRGGADDIESLANHLELDKFAVLGYSSGGPNAMACAACLPSRVSACGLISSDGPYSTIGGGIVEQVYGVSEITSENNVSRIMKEHESLRQSYQSLTKADRKELALLDLATAVLQGIDKGPAQDGLLESRPWDFELSSLNAAESPPVLLWHGEADDAVPPDVARHIASQIPSIAVQFTEGESHSMIRRHWDRFLVELVAAGSKR
ncbi:unnamed protein product [Ectocarpus fasciculatus]